ncbi:chemotaxis protein CheA [Alicyclobacillus sp. TC]|uniref:chemotaxis protein CheA n=1 Tax=Alicyclobacillus sp. TC TaxID=2606450 RepID=UPI0019326F9B|nr:chemotaxis protein CheA [Alicyclobacillus sp. TC]QRF23701.1 chemotaxis protein CheA [Alicyclobacillus sp. TC]
MPALQNAEYLQAFIEETSDNLQLLNDLCLRLESEGSSDELFAAMFRAAHTLKGMSASMGFQKMATLTHRLEDVLGVFRENPGRLTTDSPDILLSGIDQLSLQLERIIDSGIDETGSDDAIIHSLQELYQRLTNAAVSPHPEVAATVDTTEGHFTDIALHIASQAAEAGLLAGVLTVNIAPDCQMKSVRALVVMRELEQWSDILECSPSAEHLQDGRYSENIAFLAVLREISAEEAMRNLSNISEVVNVTFVPLIEYLSTHRTDPTTTSAAAHSPTPSLTADQVDSQKESAKQPAAPMKVERTLRVPIERIDHLLDRLSEMVIARSQLASATEAGQTAVIREMVDRLGRISGDIQSGLMSLRMVSVDTLFQRFPRLVRDLSKSLQKEIHFLMEGGETELDRTVVDEMGEALVHIIRNAADHGIESADIRRQAGKPEAGTLKISAFSSGQNVYIEVADDGGGIDSEAVLNKAIARGLVDEKSALMLKPEQIYDFLFASGFSTAEKITDISGRGVGLDAVRNKVQSLGGKISILSEKGKGTTFRIQLPLTLAVLPALLFMVSNESFAVPLGSVEEVLQVYETDLEAIGGERFLRHRDGLIPLLDAGDAFYEQSSAIQFPWSAILCKEGNRRLAILVDDIVGEQEIVNKPLGKYLQSVRGFSGATILGDGTVGLILDLDAWLSA